MGSCVPKSKYNELEIELEEAYARISQLKEQIEDLETELATSRQNYKALSYRVEQQNSMKYIYASIQITVPKLYHSNATYGYDWSSGNYKKEIDEVNEVIWEEVVFTTDIYKITNYKDEYKYKLLDEAEKEVKTMRMPRFNQNFSVNVEMKIQDKEMQSLINYHKSKMTASDCFVFDSYKEAREHKVNEQKGKNSMALQILFSPYF